uniref:FLYWCH-type domain-containing protein n=1 Tax=Ditylenchus dipsaci TaxID=166011 RepID=A0A915DHS5_9BILA
MGRVWNEGGKIAACFSWGGHEYRKNIGSLQILIECTSYDYEWRSFPEAAKFGDKEWHPVQVNHRKGDISPGVLMVDGKELLGRLICATNSLLLELLVPKNRWLVLLSIRAKCCAAEPNLDASSTRALSEKGTVKKQLPSNVMDANNFLRDGRLSFGAIGQAMGMDQAALMVFLQNALNAAQPPAVPVVEEVIDDNNLIINDEDESEEEDMDTNDITIVKSQKGTNKAVHQGFQFVSQRKNFDGSIQDWMCDKHKAINGSCEARLQTIVISNVFRKFIPHDFTRAHNHSVDPMAVPISNMKSSMKRRAIDTREVILNCSLIQKRSLAAAQSLSDSAVRKMIRRQRIKAGIPVVEGDEVREIDIRRRAKNTQTTAGKKKFLSWNSSVRSREEHEWSSETKTVYMDGSFKITPAPFYQVYAILAERTSRAENRGKWVFPIIRELWPDFKPTSISVDFEMATIQALVEIFPVKNFKKKIADSGLTVRYRIPEYSIRARMIIALAFVPPDQVLACYNKLRIHLLAYSEDLAPVLTWIKRNYIGTAMRPAMFPIRWWSCYERTLAGEDRTNNLLRPLIDDSRTILVWIIRLLAAFFKTSREYSALTTFTMSSSWPAKQLRRSDKSIWMRTQEFSPRSTSTMLIFLMSIL